MSTFVGRQWLALLAATTLCTAAVVAGPSAPAPQTTDPLARAPDTDFRVVVWNVFGFPGMRRDRGPVFKRILQALDADVLMLQEVSGTSDAVESWLPPATSDGLPWHVELRGGEMVVAVRGHRDLALVFRRPQLPTATGFYPTLGELLFGRGNVAAVGLLVTDGPRRLLAVPVHYPNDEPGRMAAAPVLRDAVNLALTETKADAAIVAGDFNLYFERGAGLVGRKDALEIVQRGVTIGGAPLAVLEPYQLGGGDQATWRGADALPPPGRLDWLLYSDVKLEPVGAFVFEAADLSPEWLRVHGLEADDSDRARTSDHLPIVADFRWRR